MNNMFKQLSNKYLLVSLLIVLCCPILIVSYSSFIKTTNNYKSNEMMIGNLLYSMKIDDISTSNVVVPANGEKETVTQPEMDFSSFDNGTTDSFSNLLKNLGKILIVWEKDDSGKLNWFNTATAETEKK